MTGQRVAVIGAGMIGAQVAYRLQTGGAQVTLIDAGGPGGVATAASFGWINASFHLDAHHYAIRAEGLAAWGRLLDDLSLPVAPCGALCWEEDPVALRTEGARLRALGYTAEDVSRARFASLAPHVGTPPDHALLFPTEMAAESPHVAAQLVMAATDAGARLLTGARVTQLPDTPGAPIKTEAGDLTVDHVVLCGGVASAALLEPLGIALPLARRPALVLRTRPVRPLGGPMLITPVGEIRQLPDGSILMPAVVNHQSDDTTEITGSVEAAAEEALSRMQGILADLPLEIAQVTLAHRPYPQDGLPAVGQVAPGLSVAVMHSGITLGAIMGELVATEVQNGPDNVTSHWLAPYRPDRLA